MLENSKGSAWHQFSCLGTASLRDPNLALCPYFPTEVLSLFHCPDNTGCHWNSASFLLKPKPFHWPSVQAQPVWCKGLKNNIQWGERGRNEQLVEGEVSWTWGAFPKRFLFERRDRGFSLISVSRKHWINNLTCLLSLWKIERRWVAANLD